MRPARKGQTNYAILGAAVLSLFCWLGLYAVWADFGGSGFELLRHPGVFASLEGAVLIALNAFGLLALATFATAGIAALVGAAHPERTPQRRRMSGTPR